MMKDAKAHPVVVIGAGLAGLACAQHLRSAGRAVITLESADRPGGRVRTDEVSTPHGIHRVDRGFQVYLTAYPEGQRVLDLEALRLKPFISGASVRYQGKFHRLADPLRFPGSAIKSLIKPGPLLTHRDIAALARMDLGLRRASPESAWDATEESAEAFLRDRGLSDTVINAFFRPFFGGVFLDRSLKTSARKLRYTYNMFAKGTAALPAGGMGAIPAQLAEGLEIRTACPVHAIERPTQSHTTAHTPAHTVRTAAGDLSASAVVIATDATAAASLAQAAGITGVHQTRWKRTITLTFDAQAAPTTEPILFLNGDGLDQGPVNHAAIVSNLQPAYAPKGRAQICANIVAPADMDRPEPQLVADAQQQMVDWFGPEARSWNHIKTDDIREALPDEDAPALSTPRRPVETNTPGIFLAGDYLDNGSINGALESGRRAAEALLADASLTRA